MKLSAAFVLFISVTLSTCSSKYCQDSYNAKSYKVKIYSNRIKLKTRVKRHQGALLTAPHYHARISFPSLTMKLCHGRVRPTLCPKHKYTPWIIYGQYNNIMIKSKRRCFLMSEKDQLVQHCFKKASGLFKALHKMIFQLPYDSKRGYNVLKHKASGKYLGLDDTKKLIFVEENKRQVIPVTID